MAVGDAAAGAQADLLAMGWSANNATLTLLDAATGAVEWTATAAVPAGEQVQEVVAQSAGKIDADTHQDILVEAGRAEGGVCWQPENPMPADGLFYPPTLITGLAPASVLAQEEIFGPVLVSMTFRTQEEALALANNSRYGLAASVWSEIDQRHARRGGACEGRRRLGELDQSLRRGRRLRRLSRNPGSGARAAARAFTNISSRNRRRRRRRPKRLAPSISQRPRPCAVPTGRPTSRASTARPSSISAASRCAPIPAIPTSPIPPPGATGASGPRQPQGHPQRRRSRRCGRLMVVDERAQSRAGAVLSRGEP